MSAQVLERNEESRESENTLSQVRMTTTYYSAHKQLSVTGGSVVIDDRW